MKQCERCGTLCKRDQNYCPNCRSVDFLWSDGTVQRGQKLIPPNDTAEVNKSETNVYNDVTQTYFERIRSSGSGAGSAAIAGNGKKFLIIGIVAIIAVLIFAAALLFSVNKNDEEIKNREPKSISSDTLMGSIVKYGEYEQDGDTDNGKEPIEWILLEKEKGKALLISEKALENLPFDDNFVEDWKSSSLHGWLNKEFLNEAFLEEEIEDIVENEETEDNEKVFLLTKKEIEDYVDQKDRRCKATEYVKKSNTVMLDEKGYVYWWVNENSIGNLQKCYVNPEGNIPDNCGSTVNDKSLAVRPCIWVEMKD